MTTPTQFDHLFHERANRLLALSKLSQIVVIALGQANQNAESPFSFSFKKIGDALPQIYSTHASLSMPEYRAVGLTDGLTLIATIAEIEGYLQDIVAIVIQKHPEKIGKSTLDVSTLSGMSSISQAIEHAARSFVERMMFESPKQYKRQVQDILSFNSTEFDASWKVFAEAKATR